jgi:hypothetical protein
MKNSNKIRGNIMSNLGGYQLLTTLAKKSGSPGKLVALLIGGGVAIGLVAGKGITYTSAKVKAKIDKIKTENKFKDIIFDVIADGKDNSGLEFRVGDKYRILESDGDAILIEKLGDIKNPYFLSGDFLRTISNFTD